jgi:hypothetical protein
VTPETLSYFSEDLAQNASRGVINRVSDVKLLNGDLSEAWREGGTDYATVAMRYRSRHRPRRRRRSPAAPGGHGILDLPPQPKRALDPVRHPAGVSRRA